MYPENNGRRLSRLFPKSVIRNVLPDDSTIHVHVISFLYLSCGILIFIVFSTAHINNHISKRSVNVQIFKHIIIKIVFKTFPILRTRHLFTKSSPFFSTLFSSDKSIKSCDLFAADSSICVVYF